MTAPDFAAEGLLDGLPDDRGREARLELLVELHERGVALEDLRRAVAEQRLALLPVEIELGGEARWTANEMAERLGVDMEWAMRQRQAAGLPAPGSDDRAFSEEDVEALERARALRDAGLTDDAALELTRVMGREGATVAEAVRTQVGRALLRAGDTERDLALRLAEVTRVLLPHLGRSLEWMVLLHLRQQLREDFIARTELESGEPLPNAHDVGVAFADLVDFTRLGTSVAVEELGAVAGRLASLAAEAAKPPVRLVKTIGDAAMLVSLEPAPLLDATLALVDAADAEGEEFPQLRAGLAVGPALSRGGDWYGHTVNLASRVTGVARPGSVLVTGEAQDTLDAGYRWSFAGERRLKGIKDPIKLFRARHLPEPSGDGDGADDDGRAARERQRKR